MRYRKATMSDADNLLKWKNQADTRKYAIKTHKKISKKDHLKWLEKNLLGNWIIHSDFGTVRLVDNEIAIRVATVAQGKGVGREAINHFKKRGMTAKIVVGNIASLRLFINCGFKPIKYEKGYYIFQY